MIEYKLRRAEEKDFETIYSIKLDAMREYITQTWGWNEELQRKFHKEECLSETIYIIEVNQKCAGTIGINEKENAVIISRVYLMKNFQSQGIGSAIIKDIIRNYKSKQIKLGVLKVNSRAKKLYEKLGFKIYGEENYHWKMMLKK